MNGNFIWAKNIGTHNSDTVPFAKGHHTDPSSE
mgnify:CR=1 FL=1|jgi:hypothetical protein